jgi:hypothetical protein
VRAHRLNPRACSLETKSVAGESSLGGLTAKRAPHRPGVVHSSQGPEERPIGYLSGQFFLVAN